MGNLHITPSNMENMNNPKDIKNNKIHIYEALRELDHAPSAQIGTEVPEDMHDSDDEEEPDEDAAKGDRAQNYEDDDEVDPTTNKAKPADEDAAQPEEEEPAAAEDAEPAAAEDEAASGAEPMDVDTTETEGVKEEAV